jgi:hypothetical protein
MGVKKLNMNRKERFEWIMCNWSRFKIFFNEDFELFRNKGKGYNLIKFSKHHKDIQKTEEFFIWDAKEQKQIRILKSDLILFFFTTVGYENVDKYRCFKQKDGSYYFRAHERYGLEPFFVFKGGEILC